MLYPIISTLRSIKVLVPLFLCSLLLPQCGSGNAAAGSNNTSGGGSSNNGSSAPAASRVYGQAGSFTTALSNMDGVTANSLKYPRDVAADGSGVYVVDSSNNRVLYFSGTATTATRVYGQAGSFTTATANKAGVSANSLNSPSAVVIDAAGIYIADSGNARVLYYAGASTAATRVYGQGGSFTANTTNNGGVSTTSLGSAAAIAIDGAGIYIADSLNNRVLYYAGTSTTASRVYGQSGSFTANTANNGGISAASLSGPTGVSCDAGGVYVADQGNNRVLYYAGTSATASRVYGQAGNFTTSTINNGGASANSLWGPSRVVVDAGGVYVSDVSNWRVLYYAGTSTTATRVYGEMGSYSGFGNATLASADGLYEPTGIALVAGGVYIADSASNRALYYAGTSTTATRVYGQTDNLKATTANPGGANGLNSPYAIAGDASGLYVVDANNHRVLYFAGTSTTATRVYGQNGSMVSNTMNNGGISANSLSAPTGVAIDAGGVYIADNGNSRVLYYAGTSTTASRVYGQAGSFTTTSSSGITADTLFGPASVALDPGGVYIADYGHHRVLYYAGTSTTASRVYGQSGSFTTGTANNGGLSANSLYGPISVAADSNGVYAVDIFNFRILYFAGTATTATRVYGQSGSFTTNSPGLIPNASNFFGPRGVAIDTVGGGVYIVDSGFSRVLYFSGSSTTASHVYGQPGFTSYSANNAIISASTLYGPQGVAVTNAGIFIADTGNQRILFY
jgi:hypothetical protein